MNYTEEQQATNRRLWTAALRSGKYKQAIGYLHLVNETTKAETFCCLGVACKVAMENGVNLRIATGYSEVMDDGKHQVILYNKMASMLPTEVMDWLGVAGPLGRLRKRHVIYTTLSGANDAAKLTFPEIADLIDNNSVEIV